MSAVQWEITPENEVEQRHRNNLGDKEYERRKKIAEEKRESFPDSKWQEQMVVGGQFESIAMQASQEVFDQLAEKDYKFWTKLVYKVCGV